MKSLSLQGTEDQVEPGAEGPSLANSASLPLRLGRRRRPGPAPSLRPNGAGEGQEPRSSVRYGGLGLLSHRQRPAVEEVYGRSGETAELANEALLLVPQETSLSLAKVILRGYFVYLLTTFAGLVTSSKRALRRLSFVDIFAYLPKTFARLVTHQQERSHATNAGITFPLHLLTISFLPLFPRSPVSPGLSNSRGSHCWL